MCIVCVAVATIPLLGSNTVIPHTETLQTFTQPIDALSVTLPEGGQAAVSGFVNGNWTEWQTLVVDDEQDPLSQESNLVMFPSGASEIRLRSESSSFTVNPIRVSSEHVRFQVASLFAVNTPTVISRAAWGADESLLISSGTPPAVPPEASDNGGAAPAPAVPGRVSDCDLAQQNYPQEFKTDGRTVRTDARGRTYRWPQTFSKEVKMLVVHHTALKVTGDPRSGVERVRAIYKYHADSRGWGDVGYNYLVDEEGNIYEGRAGGKGVVSGHAYCNNVGTIGVALLGNFELETPTEKQTVALQKLLILLGEEYKLDLSRSTTFHGKTFTSPIVKHRDLLSTSCPGFYLTDAFSQVVRNVQAKNPTGKVKYATPAKTQTPEVEPPVRISSDGRAPGLTYQGSTSLSMVPGSQQRLSFLYTAPVGGAYEGKKIADVMLGHPDVSLILTLGSVRVPVRTGVLLPTDVPDGESVKLQMIVQAPKQSGTYWMTVGGLKFVIAVSGRRIRTDVDISRFGTDSSRFVNTDPKPERARPVSGRVRPPSRRSIDTQVTSTVRTTTQTTSTSEVMRPIRIRLSIDPDPVLDFLIDGEADGVSIAGTSRVQLRKVGSNVQAVRAGTILKEQPIIRFVAKNSGVIAVESVLGKRRTYRGTLEARIVDGELVLINELPLETYMRGISEEPDTEPYEKQRAFAIAARTYAAWYMDEKNRKFPGKPYDGSDDPAIFQAYAGAGYEDQNPSWLRALSSTSKQLLRYKGSIIKPPYFSSDDGRTRSPAEAGWNNFPFAEIFTSKPDPWCSGMENRGHGVGMSGCGAEEQANQGKTAEQILQYYYPGTTITTR
ncbi:MAG: N-acetylmuramoyl-L-alanine amidase [Candidatus Peribacteraceae bacterium]